MVRSGLGGPLRRLNHHPLAGSVVNYLTWSYHRARRLISPDGFAIAPVWVQLTLLVVLSTALILLFGLILGPFSFSLFFSPESFYELATGDTSRWYSLFIGLFVMVSGICVGGFIISILSAALTGLIEDIRSGMLPYRNKSGHILIVNSNSKLSHILEEINAKMAAARRMQNVVVLLADTAAVAAFVAARRDDTPHLNIYVRQGDLFRFGSYERLSVLGAQGMLILQDEGITDPLQADSTNVKILSLLIREPAFREMLARRMSTLAPFKFSIEVTDIGITRDIVSSLARIDGKNMIAVVSRDVIFRVLTRSLIDMTYYKIYEELLFHGGFGFYFVDPARFGDLTGSTFQALSRGFTRGALIGRTRVVEGRFVIELGPGAGALQRGEWLVFIARGAEEITWEAGAGVDIEDALVISAPSEIVARRIGIIGDRNDFDGIDDFLDEASRAFLVSNRIVREHTGQYFDRELILSIRDRDFDVVIINLEDELAFRLMLYIQSILGEDDPLVARVIIVLEDPICEYLLNRNIGRQNAILSDKLAARYMTQLAYQRSLEGLFEELLRPEGHELNLLDVGSGVPREYLTSKDAVKQMLLSSGMIYVGTVDRDRNVRFDADRFDDTHQLIVLAMGEH